MGLFNFKKNKKEEAVKDKKTVNKEITLDSFRKEFIWGFTQGNPMHHSDKKDDFFKLIKPLTGDNGTITIGASFHPYQIIDKAGKDIWEILFTVIKANNFCDYEELIRDKYFFHMTPPGAQAFQLTIWQDDRLFHEVNPEFGKYVPFLIPYLTYDNNEEPNWLKELNNGIETVGNAHAFIDRINNASRFLMPEPTFIVGFGEFNKDNRKTLIDHYVNFLNNSIKK